MKAPEWLKVLAISLLLYALITVAGIWAVEHFVFHDRPVSSSR